MTKPTDTAGLVIGVNVCGKHFANCRLCETACTANAERIETLLRQQADSDKRIADVRTMIIHQATELAAKTKRIAELKAALGFYADPENYHAIAIFGDPPCGEFADDFDDEHGHEDYDRPMPGKRARAALNNTAHEEIWK